MSDSSPNHSMLINESLRQLKSAHVRRYGSAGWRSAAFPQPRDNADGTAE